MPIKVDIVPNVNETRVEHLLGKTVIVIDVLRSTTSIITAILNGCKEVYPVETSGQAFSLKDQDTLLVGERFCKKIQGFDLSNSPSELSEMDLSGKKIVISTTNGTIAIHKAAKGEHVLIGSFLNGTAVANEAIALKKDITLLCSGTRSQFAFEDALCAGFIISQLLTMIPLECSDFAWMTLAAYENLKNEISVILPKTTTGTRLSQLGLIRDLEYCAQKDICDLVPYFKDERIFVHPKS